MEKKGGNWNNTPPRWAERLLYWFSDSREIEYIAGDLEELYLQNTQNKGKTRAKIKYIKDVLDMVRPFNLFQNKNSIPTGMYRNYIKIAFRNMMRNKAYSVINVTGLAIGMAATILNLLFVQNELSYDRYHENADRIYRVSRAWYNESGEVNLHLGQVAPPFGPLIKSDYDGIVEEAVRLMGMTFLVKGEGEAIEEPHLFFSDPNVFKVFTWEAIEGDLTTALDLPNSIVLTRSAAEKYFGQLDVIGNTLLLGNQYLPQPFEVKVTAVIEDIPDNSHFHPELLGPMAMVEAYYGGPENFMKAWGSNNLSTYLLLKEGYPYKDLEIQLGKFLNNHLTPTSSGRMPNEYNKLSLWPLTDIHLHSQLDSEIEPNGDIAYVYLYSMVALFILIIACINFVNLATARSAKRAREVGMRKVMGAVRPMLIRQFIAESLLYAVFALVLSVLMVSLVLPWFNDFAQKSLVLDLLNNHFLVVLLLGITIITGFVAGSYPAFYLSAYKPVDTLKGEVNAGKSKFGLRSILVVFQFMISIILLIGVGVVNDQLDYVKSKDLGFDDNRVLVLPINQSIYNNLLDTKNSLLQNPGIERGRVCKSNPIRKIA
jgi:putative ABC transport system permease protein